MDWNVYLKIFSLILLQHNQTAKFQIAEQNAVADPSDVEKVEEAAAIKLR